jgi:antitoxin MazE
MKARIVRVGNSRGVRLPKPLLEQSGLLDEVEIHAEPGRIVIESATRPRVGWGDAAREMAAEGEDGMIDEATPTRFDGAEWTW